jgi:DNA-binding MarR family transcriptional regulator
MEQQSEVREMMFAIDQARRRLLQPRFTQLGLTLGQGQPRILNYLLNREDITQKELADACHLEVTTLSRTLDHMEKADLLMRRRPPDCRRSYRIVLTEKGRETAREVHEAFAYLDQTIWKGFTEEEMEKLWEGLKKIRENLEEAN